MMNPMSLYSARVPGSAEREVVKAARSSSSRECALEEQLLVGGQAGGVGEEHAEGDVAAAGIGFAAGVGHEFGDDAEYGSFEFEQAALVEDHRHGRGGDDFGDRGQVEESVAVTARSKSPPSRKEREKGGAPSRFVVHSTKCAEGFECDEAIRHA